MLPCVLIDTLIDYYVYYFIINATIKKRVAPLDLRISTGGSNRLPSVDTSARLPFIPKKDNFIR